MSRQFKSRNLVNFTIFLIVVLSLNAAEGQERVRISAEEAMRRLSAAYFKQVSQVDIRRPKALSTEDWPEHITSFVKVMKSGLPILIEPNLRVSKFKVIGVTKSREIFQFIDRKESRSTLNSFNREPDNSGLWYKVRLLNGKEGWIFAHPKYRRSRFASYFEKRRSGLQANRKIREYPSRITSRELAKKTMPALRPNKARIKPKTEIRKSEDSKNRYRGRMSMDEAMERIANAYYKQAPDEEARRPKAYSVNDWPRIVSNFVKIEKSGLPILGTTSLNARNLEVFGMTQQGEILQYLGNTKVVAIPNPLSKAPDNSGVWYKVKVLNGNAGWIFIQPLDSQVVNASYFKRKVAVQPKPTSKTRASEDEGITEKDLRIGLIFLVLVILFIVIISSTRKRKSIASPSSSYQSSYSPEFSSGPGRQSTSASTKPEEEKAGGDWPFRPRDIIIKDKSVVEKNQLFPDRKVGRVKETLLRDTEIQKDTLLGPKKVGIVKRDFLGDAKEIVDTDDNVIAKIKPSILGGKRIISKNGKDLGEYKEKK